MEMAQGWNSGNLDSSHGFAICLNALFLPHSELGCDF